MHQTQTCVQSNMLTTRKPSLPQRLQRTSAKLLLPRCFSFTQICCMRMPSTPGTRLSRSRCRLICSRIFKACLGKAQVDFCPSHSTTASCSTFSPCFQTTRLSKKSTTFPMCSRSPRGLAYVSCTVCRAAQHLRRAAALLVHQPKL
jgi:hypothetical protein